MDVVLLDALTRIMFFNWKVLNIVKLNYGVDYYGNILSSKTNIFIKPGIKGHGMPRPEHLSILAVWVK